MKGYAGIKTWLLFKMPQDSSCFFSAKDGRGYPSWMSAIAKYMAITWKYLTLFNWPIDQF